MLGTTLGPSVFGTCEDELNIVARNVIGTLTLARFFHLRNVRIFHTLGASSLAYKLPPRIHSHFRHIRLPPTVVRATILLIRSWRTFRDFENTPVYQCKMSSKKANCDIWAFPSKERTSLLSLVCRPHT